MADLSSISFGGNAQHLVRALEEALTEDITNKSAAIVDGSASDYAEYKNQAGVIAGLNLALKHLHEISAKVFQK